MQTHKYILIIFQGSRMHTFIILTFHLQNDILTWKPLSHNNSVIMQSWDYFKGESNSLTKQKSTFSFLP